MKKIAMFALIVTALVTASTAFARPYGCCRGYYGGRYYGRGYYGGGYYYGGYGYCYGGARVVGAGLNLIGASLDLAADIVTLPLRGAAYCPARAVYPAAPVPVSYAYPTVTCSPAPVSYAYPTVTYRPAPAVYAPPVYVVR